MKILESTRPLTVGTVISANLMQNRANYAEDCDWVELRLDHLHPEREAVTALPTPEETPILLTARGPEEGGANSLLQAEREKLLNTYLKSATAIDIEAAQLDQWSHWISQARDEHDFELIASHHDFHQTPSLGTCEGIVEQAFASGANLVKFAFHVESLSDMQLGIDLLGIRFPGPIAVMGMGPLAPASRLLYAQHGSCLNYGYLGNTEAAPGQWPARLLKQGIAALQLIDPAHR